MKISDKELRDTTGSVYTPYERELASELLQRRREVRRLRNALQRAVSLIRDPMAAKHPRARMLNVLAVLAAALKPQRGGK